MILSNLTLILLQISSDSSTLTVPTLPIIVLKVWNVNKANKIFQFQIERLYLSRKRESDYVFYLYNFTTRINAYRSQLDESSRRDFVKLDLDLVAYFIRFIDNYSPDSSDRGLGFFALFRTSGAFFIIAAEILRRQGTRWRGGGQRVKRMGISMGHFPTHRFVNRIRQTLFDVLAIFFAWTGIPPEFLLGLNPPFNRRSLGSGVGRRRNRRRWQIKTVSVVMRRFFHRGFRFENQNQQMRQ